IGWRSANSLIARFSISRCAASIFGSRWITICASSVSRRATAESASATAVSAKPPMRGTSCVIASSSSENALTVCSAIVAFTRRAKAGALRGRLEAATAISRTGQYIVLRARVARVSEDFLGRAGLHQLAQVEEGRLLRNPRGLRHRVRDDDDAVILTKLVD